MTCTHNADALRARLSQIMDRAEHVKPAAFLGVSRRSASRLALAAEIDR